MSLLTSLDPTVAGIGAALITAIACLIVADRRPARRIRPARTNDLAWIDERIKAETDPARRAAWRIIRRQEEEEES